MAHRAIDERALRNHVGEVLRAPEAGMVFMITVRRRRMPRLARAAGQEAELRRRARRGRRLRGRGAHGGARGGRRRCPGPRRRARHDARRRDGRRRRGPRALGETPAWLEKLRGFVDLHIDQTRDVAAAGRPAEVVTRLTARLRLQATLDGRADHAGHDPAPGTA